MLELRSILRLSKTALVSFLENHVKRVESTIKISNGSTQGHVKLEWRRRWITVEGQATPAGFTIAFEGREGISVRDRFNLQLTRPDNRSYAKISVNGTDDSFKFSAPSLPKIAKAVLISVPRLMAVLVRSSSDILTFIRTKDAATSERLRRRFGVTSVTDPGRSVPPGFFSHHSTRITQNIEATIILPIYNAAEDLGQLLPHLHRNPYPIILVNDGSEDPRIPQLISNFVLKNENAKLIENSQNQGFVSSINKGIAESSGHIIILNSDALPPPMDWATRLLEPIIRDSKIATVTPFSNNAEIISIPSKSDASQITYNAVREIDNFASHISDRHSEIELPTGIGFCMAMNQDYVDRIGGFDPAFGRGYGEEVDWCQKAKRLGGRSIGLASLFVGHKGGSSFGAQKTARIRDASQIISKRYPDYDATVQNWVESAPARIQTLALSLHGWQTPVQIRSRYSLVIRWEAAPKMRFRKKSHRR